jgi:hypothetical protein
MLRPQVCPPTLLASAVLAVFLCSVQHTREPVEQQQRQQLWQQRWQPVVRPQPPPLGLLVWPLVPWHIYPNRAKAHPVKWGYSSIRF